MTLFTTDVADALLPNDYGALIINPLEAASVALQVSTVIPTVENSFHAPVVEDDGSDIDFVNEGDDLTGDGPDLGEVVVVPGKIGRVVPISNELAADSSPEAAQLVADAIARKIAKGLDRAYFGALSAPNPAGLGSLADVSTVFTGGASWTNLDGFIDAEAESHDNGGTLGFYVASKADYAALSKLKTGSDLNTPLLGTLATNPLVRTIFGVPILMSPYVTTGQVWGIDPAFSLAIVRKDVEMKIDESVFFTTDRTAVRVLMRVGFGFPNHASLVKVSLGGDAS